MPVNILTESDKLSLTIEYNSYLSNLSFQAKQLDLFSHFLRSVCLLPSNRNNALKHLIKLINNVLTSRLSSPLPLKSCYFNEGV